MFLICTKLKLYTVKFTKFIHKFNNFILNNIKN